MAGAKRVERLLLAAIALLLLYLVLGDKPWDPELAERLASGKPLRAKDYAASFEWWASLVNAGLAAVLFATRRSWLRPDAAPPLASLARPPRPSVAALGLVLAAVIALAALAAPRLRLGLWDDEQKTARIAVAGYYDADASGRLRFHRASWRDTLWGYDPNNHIGYSVLARLATAPWPTGGAAGPGDERALEPALRLPAFLFGLASVASAFLLLWRLGYPGAGVIAAWLLALHPWELRYAAEARGYSLELLLATASAYLLVEALHRGRWRDWLALAGAELMMLWTYPPTILYVALLNLAAAGALLRLRRGTAALAPQLGRWLVSGVVAAMLLLQLMLPNLPQLAAYLGEQQRPIDGRFVESVLSHFFAGEPWSWRRRAAPQFPELARLAAEWPLAFQAGAAASVLALLLGALRLLRARAPRPALVPLLTLGAPLTLLVGWLRSDELYVWHLCYLLAPLACVAALGLSWPAALRPRLGLAIPVVYLAAFAWWTGDARTALRSRPLEPMRESVALTRPLAPDAPGQEAVITASFSDEPFYYDPFVRRLRQAEELRALVGESDASGRPLFVNVGRFDLAEKRKPELLEVVRSRALFDEVAVLEGFEPEHTRRIYRHVPRAPRPEAVSAAPAGGGQGSGGR